MLFKVTIIETFGDSQLNTPISEVHYVYIPESQLNGMYIETTNSQRHPATPEEYLEYMIRRDPHLREAVDIQVESLGVS